jgi:hypothetical protein
MRSSAPLLGANNCLCDTVTVLYSTWHRITLPANQLSQGRPVYKVRSRFKTAPLVKSAVLSGILLGRCRFMWDLLMHPYLRSNCGLYRPPTASSRAAYPVLLSRIT